MANLTIKIEEVGQLERGEISNDLSFNVMLVVPERRLSGREAADLFESLVCSVCSERNRCYRAINGVFALGSTSDLKRSNVFSTSIWPKGHTDLENAKCRRAGVTYPEQE